MKKKIFFILFFSGLLLLIFTILLVQAGITTNTVVPTDSMYYSPDASGSCVLGNIQTDDTLTCTLTTMDGGETGYVNITHASSIPDGAEINEVWACIIFALTGKTGDNAGEVLTIDVGHTDGGLTWQNQLTETGTNIAAYRTESTQCWNITDFITTEAAAEDVKIKITYTEGDDNNQGMNIDYSNVTITYTTSDTCSCPGLNQNWEINMGDSCNIADACNLGTGNITFTGTGTTTFNAAISTMNLQYPSTGQTLNIGSNALVIIG